ncbi:carboxypeptidase-like regulatory domain-containing protein, partial [Xanthovirga aplysinae]|uniref:carboxypeptidase-like regulatory domain-containing protein n=1 Tax=Xanthovirga aplysinae TaxID=2529853 RepID=UPI0012BC68FF
INSWASKITFLLYFFISFFILIFFPKSGFSQDKEKILQLSGVIVDSSTNNPISGAHVYIPASGRGTSSDFNGFFTLPVLAEDSIVISSVGFQLESIIVPHSEGDRLTTLVEMKEDTTWLPPLEVLPFATEKEFKNAILAMKFEEERSPFLASNYTIDIFDYGKIPMDFGENQRLYFKRQVEIQSKQGFIPEKFENAFLNPINWSKFIQSLKNGDYKRKD